MLELHFTRQIVVKRVVFYWVLLGPCHIVKFLPGQIFILRSMKQKDLIC